MSNTAVFGIYSSLDQVQNAVEEMKRAGFRNSDVSVLLPENIGTKDIGVEKHTKAPEGGTAGAFSGIVLGGALGWLVGVGSLAIPGLAPLVAAGPIVAALSGAGAGAVVGSLTGTLIGFGI